MGAGASLFPGDDCISLGVGAGSNHFTGSVTNAISIGNNSQHKGTNSTVIGNSDAADFYIGTSVDSVVNLQPTADGQADPNNPVEGFQLFITADGRIIRSQTATQFVGPLP